MVQAGPVAAAVVVVGAAVVVVGAAVVVVVGAAVVVVVLLAAFFGELEHDAMSSAAPVQRPSASTVRGPLVIGPTDITPRIRRLTRL
jgi:hypothetical protein